MKDLTAKNISKFQTHDGYAWSASFYLRGKKIGTASDQGHGGEMDTRGIDAGALAEIEVYAKTLPTFGGDMNIAQSAEMVLEGVMWDTVDQKKTKSLLKRKVVAVLPKGIYEWKIAKGHTADEVMEKVLEQYPDAKLLNRLPLDEANRLLHPTAESLMMKDFKLQ